MSEKIDFVLPWVDGNDKEWQKEKAKYNPIQNNDSNAQSRYRDMGTLRYVLRSIEQNCPWYNKIYLITAGHYPKWLDINHEKIVLVTHEELYFDKSHLPTFNSSSIEMNLANIKGLSDKFVYLNDDTIIMREIEKDRFFRNGKPVDFFSHGWIPRNKLFEKFRGIDTWINSLNNNIKLVNNKYYPYTLRNEQLFHKSYPLKVKVSNFLLKYIYKKIFWLEHWHHPQPYLKKTLEDAYDNFRDEMMTCSANRFRSNNDLTQYLYRYIRLLKGDFEPCYCEDASIVSDKNIDNIDILNEIIDDIDSNTNIKFACFNDSISLKDNEYQLISKRLLQYLNSYFPNRASFELEEQNI